jgi:PiT family inorganic phosphate transporter
VSRFSTFTLVVLIVVVALIFDYTNGFHDAANSIAMSGMIAALVYGLISVFS